MAIYLQLKGLDSDATDAHSHDWIACTSFTGGAARAMHCATGGGGQREVSNAELLEIGLRMKMHKASPRVFLASLVGKARDASIRITRSADASGSHDFLEIKLHDVFVTRYSMNCAENDGNGGFPWEMISLSYTKIEAKYIPDDGNGHPLKAIPVGFDMKPATKL
jgi:type VI secretion system Hcp family effector